MRSVLAACMLAVVLSACGSDRPPLRASCSGPPDAVVAALARAPRAVTLRDGTTLARCVRDADSAADLQSVGVAFHIAAQRLRDRAAAGDEQAATALGYLVGATRKGADATQGVSAELAVRVARVAGRLLDAAPALRQTVLAGQRAGERLG